MAHHSAAGYDLKKTLTAPATLKEFRWGAPHCYAVFVIEGPDGKPRELTLESDTPGMFARQGFKPRDFEAGQKVQLGWHPARNGALGGHIASIKFANGRVFHDVFFQVVKPPNGEGSSK